MKTLKQSRIKYFCIVLFAIFGGIILGGAVKGFSDHIKGDKSYSIERTLVKNCDCDAVSQFMYFRGVQYDTKDGVTNEKAEYELTNCTYKSLASEAYRINEILKDNVHDYEDLDLLKLEFIGPEKRELITIKNGVIQ